MKPRARTLTALITLAAVALPAAGCGVQPTGVIPAGPAPSVAGSRSELLTLYFLLDGQLAPVQRPWSGARTPEIALAQLFDGPNDEEQKIGYSSLLPTGVSPQFQLTSADGTPTVTVPYPLQKLPPDGMSQISCTTVAAVMSENQYVSSGGITLVGPQLTIHQVGCGIG
ncbi:hypothetical protein [Amycolatopsis sp. NBC_01480]|uniref:hypothetical protein n=1 Tax=Amycolatopsis sp. NBC_01480 TaxID=2903562 RepID=UPI002E2E7CEB|nr:hypothetical protein [Amycolatopsis sp. NBC_01480]